MLLYDQVCLDIFDHFFDARTEEMYWTLAIIQYILVYGSVGNHQSTWTYDYGYDYGQMFWSHMQLLVHCSCVWLRIDWFATSEIT